MIPKQLFFIWICDNKPNYVDFAIKSFKEVNPDFKINFLNYTIQEIESLTDSCVGFDIDVYNCINHILKMDKYQLSIKSYKSYGRKFCQILANILRLELLSKYGGIYLDCDTFPIKPFDDFLLNRKHFCSYSCTSYDLFSRHKDCHFLGSQGNNFYYEIFHEFSDNIEINDINFENDEKWKERRIKFYNCELNLNDYKDLNYNYYIEHFIDRTWKNGKTPSCQFDKLLKK